MLQHLADIAAGSPPPAPSTDEEEDVAAAGLANNNNNINEPEPLDPAYIQSLKFLAEKKVREAEEKAKMDEESEWFAAAAAHSSDNFDGAADLSEREGGNINNYNGTPTTEDILQSIEESVDYNNQTSGFVSSFALPLTPIAPVSTDHDESGLKEADDCDDSDDNSHDNNSKESLSTRGIDVNNYQTKRATRPQGVSSPASIFRTTSSSPSTSPTNNIIGVSSPSSPYDDSVASDSTETTNNTSHSSFITTYKSPLHQQHLSHVTEIDDVIEEAVSPLASPMVTFDKKRMGNDHEVNKHDSRRTKQTPKQQVQRPKTKSKSNSDSSTTTTTSWTKRKNNLVISPVPQSKRQPQQQSKATKNNTTKPSVTIDDTTTLPIQLSNKPPTHPSIKPSTSPSRKPILLRTQSTLSDATDLSVDLSEATPITTPAKSSWFRSYSSEDENEEEEDRVVGGSSGASVDNDDEEEDNDDSFTKDNNNANDAMHQQHVGKISQSSADLVGLEIFEYDARSAPTGNNDDITPKNNNCTTTKNNNFLRTTNSNDNEIRGEDDMDALNSSTEYTVSSLFNPSSNRQYKNENLFFNGIYQSGLQSSSFEQVDTTPEDMMCMDTEIELVYNCSGAEQPSFLVEGDTDTSFESSSSSVVVADDLEECASVEERREVVRRIQQWRRGRARESSAKDDSTNEDRANGGGVEELEENEEHDFNYDDDDDDSIEMAPLTLAKSDNIDLDGCSISSTTNDDPSRRITSLSSFFGKLLPVQPSRGEYSSNRRRKKPRYDDVDFDRNTDNCFNCFAKWKKLMIITVIFLLFGSLLSGDGLEKHEMDESYNIYENDPLAKSNFVEHGHLPDDNDDYDGLLSYHFAGVPTHSIHDAETIQNYQQSAKPDVVADDVWVHFELEDDEFDTPLFESLEVVSNDEVNDEIAAGSSIAQPHFIKAEQYNALIGIDSIVVLGDPQPGLDWLVDKLKRLYPDLIIRKGFQNDAGNSGRVLRGSKSQAHRITKVIDPLSNEVIGKKDDTADSKHTLVIALFLNPYDWVALMYTTQNSKEVSWRDFMSTEWQSHANMMEYRASMINSAVVELMGREDVRLVIPVKYEKLVDSFSNFDNYVSSSGTATPELPGIVGVIDDIQSHTGLRVDEAAGWNAPRDRNQFWAAPIGCNGHICHPKIQKLREDAEFINYINEHVDWKAEHLIGYQQLMAPKLAIEQIVVLGERHSGAEWLVDRLSRCFPNTTVKYGFDSRPGKFFQVEPTKTKAQPNTLVISVFVNPFDWVDMMRRNPINAPTHKDLAWADFVTTPWERKRSNMDKNIEDTANAVCSYGFSYYEVIPCMTQRDPNTDSFPLYELRPDGTAYTNLLELREDKIKNFLGTAKFDGVVDLISIRYEDLLWDENYTDDALYLTLPFPGIAGLLEKIRDQTKLVPDISAGWILDEDGIFRAEQLGVGVAKLDPYFVQWMEDNIDWDVEDLVGYSL